MAGIQNHQEARPAAGHPLQQAGDLFVGEIPGGVSAIPADEGFVEAIWLEVPQLSWHRLLGAMAAEVKESQIVLTRLAEVPLKLLDHGLAICVLVEKSLTVQLTNLAVDTILKKALEGIDVVAAAPERTYRRRIVVNANEESEDAGGEGCHVSSKKRGLN
jgi:hypothetical protein